MLFRRACKQLNAQSRGLSMCGCYGPCGISMLLDEESFVGVELIASVSPNQMFSLDKYNCCPLLERIDLT